MTAVVANMTSTPNSQSTIMEPSTADKKRNKLGYHRTSVACVHCRRRKIRCLVAADDAQGRCENCIRLRKECQFFPVDQQPPIEKKSRPNSRVETASTDPSTASSSPPAVNGGGEPEAFFPYQPIALSSAQDVGAFNTGTFAGSPMASFSPDTAHSIETPVPWDEFTTISDPQMLATMSAAGKTTIVNMPPNVWSPAPNSMVPIPSNSSLPGAPTVPSQTQGIAATPSYTIQADGSVWPVPPARSMTYPAQPDMAASYANPAAYPQPMAAELKRRMTSPQSFPPTVINPQSPPPAELQGAPVSVSYPGQPGAMGYPAWQDVHGMAPMGMMQYPIYAGDAAAQQAAFGSPPMGHPGPGPSSGP